MSEKCVEFYEIYDKYVNLRETLEIYRVYRKLRKMIGEPTEKYLTIDKIKDNLTGKRILELVERLEEDR